MKTQARNTSAFTLIELLIVVAIIGILAAIAVPNFLNAQLKARLARVQADFQSIGTALEMYNLDNNGFPNDGLRGFLGRSNGGNGWIQLTTPVGYINTGSLIDPFKPDYVTPAGDQDPNSNKALYELGTGGPAGPNEGPFSMWMVNSLGPDSAFGEPGGGGNSGDNTVSALQYPFTREIWRFDITNGLQSRGDIYRFNGGAPARTVEIVDGKPWSGS